jgi:transposase InsO family protein
MKYRFIEEHRQEMRVETMCRVLAISRSGYYAWRSQPCSKRQTENLRIQEEIREAYGEGRGEYGSPRVTDTLRDSGHPYNRKRIARLMRLMGLRAKTARRFKSTTHSIRGKYAEPDRVNRNFTAEGPNRLWTSDITYIWTREGWLYLAVVLDVWSRKIVGYALWNRLDAGLVAEACRRAFQDRQPGPGLIFHSDRGRQYASREVRTILKAHGATQSMGGRSSCYDNAITESLFHTIKTCLIYWHRYESRQEAVTSIFEYIEVFYNRVRRHSALGHKSPVAYEQKLKLA